MAAELVADAQGSERMSIKILYRWSKHGLRGVVLETVQAGGKKVRHSKHWTSFSSADARVAGPG